MRALLVCSLLFSLSAFAQSGVAVVKLLRGEATYSKGDVTNKLALEQWVSSGTIIKTSDKSFVRLVFIDKSQMNIGPNSEMKIEQFGGGDAGVIDLVKGKIRSQVSKDYLQQKDKDKSKMFIKTPNAVMGIRGTDFLISTNGVNSSAVLFEGEVVFNKVDPSSLSGGMNTDRLEAVVDSGVRIMPGEFSVIEATRPNPTVPALMDKHQVENLEKNQDFVESAPAATDEAKSGKSVVPAGLSGTTVANTSSVLTKELEQTGVAAPAASTEAPKSDMEAAKGFTNGDQVKPTNGSILHVDSGVVIAPPKDAVFDTNTNTFVPSALSGTVDTSGKFVPPAGMEITAKGEVFAKVGNEIVKLDRLSPVAGSGATFGDVASAVSKAQPQQPIAGTAPAAVGSANNAPAPKAPVSPSLSATIGQATTQQNFQAPNPAMGPNGMPAPIGQQAGRPMIEAPTLCSTCAFNPGGADQMLNNGKTNVKVETTVGTEP